MVDGDRIASSEWTGSPAGCLTVAAPSRQKYGLSCMTACVCGRTEFVNALQPNQPIPFHSTNRTGTGRLIVAEQTVNAHTHTHNGDGDDGDDVNIAPAICTTRSSATTNTRSTPSTAISTKNRLVCRVSGVVVFVLLCLAFSSCSFSRLASSDPQNPAFHVCPSILFSVLSAPHFGWPLVNPSQLLAFEVESLSFFANSGSFWPCLGSRTSNDPCCEHLWGLALATSHRSQSWTESLS